MTMITEEQIWDYLDGHPKGVSREEIEQALAGNKQLATLFEEISGLHQSLKKQSALSAPALFTDRVMAAINKAETAQPPLRLSAAPMLVFILPMLAVIVALAAFMIYKQVHITGSLSIPISLPEIKHPALYFVTLDIVIAAYFMDTLSEYRFNRKTLFS